MGSDELTGEEAIEAVANAIKITEGEGDYGSQAVEEAKELGLDRHQQAIARKYAGEGRVPVDDSTTPSFAEKLLAEAELPWTFVLDKVQFVMKASHGAGGNPSEWEWVEDGYHFRYYKYDDDRENEIHISEVEQGDSSGGATDGE